jgi:tRNA threonylcarbamoyladenosine biosynthesis protein TsaB
MHAEVLLPWIGQLLDEAAIDFTALDAIVVDRGPGGFTSLRLGLGVAQGIAIAQDLPCHPVSSLQTLAEAARPIDYRDDYRDDYRGRLLAALDARMGEIYAGWFDLAPGRVPRLVGHEQLLRPEELAAPDSAPFVVAGDGWTAYSGQFAATLHAGCSASIANVWPDAVALLRLAESVPAVEAGAVAPVYLRDKVTS